MTADNISHGLNLKKVGVLPVYIISWHQLCEELCQKSSAGSEFNILC